MQATFNESDIQSLLNKVKIFNHQIGTYELYTINDAFHYVVKLSNGTIFFTLEELQANTNETLNLEMLTSITRRFTPLVDIKNQLNEEALIPPMSNKPQPKKQPSTAKTTMYVFALIAIGLGIGVLVFFLINSYSSSTNPYSNPDTYLDAPTDEENAYYKENTLESEPEEELKEELKKREQSKPANYHLAIDWKTRLQPLLSVQTFEGSIQNNATATGFKNVKVRISGYSDTDYLVEKRNYVLTEFIDAGDSQSFKWRTDLWNNDIDRFELEIIEAESY